MADLVAGDTVPLEQNENGTVPPTDCGVRVDARDNLQPDADHSELGLEAAWKRSRVSVLL